MLPDVNAQKWDEASGCLQGILVLAGGDLEFGRLLVPAEPAPAGAFDAAGLGRQLLLEGVERAKVLEIHFQSRKMKKNLVDLVSKGTRWDTAAKWGWGHVRPENGVIQMSTTVEVDSGSHYSLHKFHEQQVKTHIG